MSQKQTEGSVAEDSSKRVVVANSWKRVAATYSGLFASTALLLSTLPLLRVQTLLQTEGEQLRSGRIGPQHACRNALSMAKRVIATESTAALWRGAAVTGTRHIGATFLGFSVSRYLRNFLQFRENDSFLSSSVAVGLISALSTSLMLYPLDLLYIRLSADCIGLQTTGVYAFKNTTAAYFKTVNADTRVLGKSAGGGLRNLWRGFPLIATSTVLHRAVFYTLFDINSRVLARLYSADKGISHSAKYAVSYGLSLAAAVAVYPLETTRKRFVANLGSDSHLRYRHSLDCFQQTLANDGAKALFRGLPICVFRALLPAFALMLSPNNSRH